MILRSKGVALACCVLLAAVASPIILKVISYARDHGSTGDTERRFSSMPFTLSGEEDYQPNELWPTREGEVVAAIEAASALKATGKVFKAKKVLEHALALHPKHPDVLTRLAELAETQEDAVKADELFARALVLAPGHSRALQGRRRTSLAADRADRRRLELVDIKRRALAAIPETDSALRRAKKEAYFQHVHHTVAIEGNTLSLGETRSILETRLAIGGKSIDEHNEVLGLDSAMKYINATLLNSMRRLTVDDLLQIHRRVLGHVDPTEGGYFRRTQVYVGGHIPPGPTMINPLIEKFFVWLNSEEASSLHPIKYAALAHYKLVHIHPFVDGNGRTSRLLMNLLLMQAGYPPVIILKQHRHLYYRHLQTANEGDVRPFIRFITDCTERTLDLYLWATSEFSHRIPAIAQTEALHESSGSFDED